MARGFLIAIEWVTYMVSVPWPSIHVLPWRGIGASAVIWEETPAFDGLTVCTVCMIVFVASQFSCVHQCITSETKGKQAVGANPGPLPGQAALLSLRNPVMLDHRVLCCSLCLYLPFDVWQKLEKGKEERGRSSFLKRYHTAMQILQYAMVQTWKPGRHI